MGPGAGPAHRPPGRGLQGADGRSGHRGPRPVAACSVLVLPGHLPTELSVSQEQEKRTRMPEWVASGLQGRPMGLGLGGGGRTREVGVGEGEPVRGVSGQGRKRQPVVEDGAFPPELR